MQMFDEMIDYVEKGQPSEWLADAEQRYDRNRLRLVTLRILQWLEPLNHLRTKADLPLEMSCPWCVDLVTWLAEDPKLGSLFAVSGTGFGFRPEIGDRARREICDRVNQRFRARLRTKV